MSSSINRASILAIGTELTTGQIINRNATWLSERIAGLGIEVILHETVPDDRELIESALDRCYGQSKLIFITGGLGPTTDDFTREVIARWCGRELEFHPPSWERVETRLKRIGIPVAQSNRQQCFFPQGARVIVNPAGTANAFSIARGEAILWVLPGPPREVEAVWDAAISDQVRERAPDARPLQLLTWQCLGKSEAELGEITEQALEGSGLQTGYRAHRPFVEIKTWCPEGRLQECRPYFQKLEAAISPWLATRQGEDLADLFLKQTVRADEIELIDSCTGGVLGERITALLRSSHRLQGASFTLATEFNSPASAEIAQGWINLALEQAAPETLTLAVCGFAPDGTWTLGLRHEGTVKYQTLCSPFSKPDLLDLAQKMTAELTLKIWREWLEEWVN